MFFAIFAVVFLSVLEGVLTAPSHLKAAGQQYSAGHKIKLSRRSLHQGPPNMQHNNPQLFQSDVAMVELASVEAKYQAAKLLLDAGKDRSLPSGCTGITPLQDKNIPSPSNPSLTTPSQITESIEDIFEPVLGGSKTTTEPLKDFAPYGLDLLYYGEMSFGTPAQELTVDIDTGSADLWVPVNCPRCANTQFEPERSSTYKNENKKFQINYGSGDASGTLASDTVSVGSVTVSKQAFGAVNRLSKEWNMYPNDGLIGLAFSSIASSQQPTFFENLIMQKAVAAPLFSVHLGRRNPSGSEVCFGCVDQSKTTGSITWIPVTSRTYWTVAMSGFAVGEKTTEVEDVVAAIDTGTTLIYLPNEVAMDLYDQIPGSQSLEDRYGPAFYSYPCDSNVDVGVVFSGKVFYINSADFNLGRVEENSTECVGGILRMTGGFPNNLAIIGDEFLKSWYSVYDYSGTARVGFAPSVNNKSR
ncbi:hypothetical protein PC9H_007548 [Pleurotus ostreatus]|uniref:Peptidase A1 domain-containing protein n=1 Tax=Pleurotus ostreatus TaxID=5322 RepID=A0A8H7DRM9_PLEOS|nr:uncharacterized protein PC9H_007548 [Pleurotus ostreatus]KAF7428327.1 hypothetical protein PC9H_007548 [Pleurotus ostreatus]